MNNGHTSIFKVDMVLKSLSKLEKIIKNTILAILEVINSYHSLILVSIAIVVFKSFTKFSYFKNYLPRQYTTPNNVINTYLSRAFKYK